MKKMLMILTLGSSIFSMASLVPIKVESFTYSSPAHMLLKAIDVQLADKAIEVCGSKKAVLGLNKINIAVRPGINDPVGELNEKKGLNLIYPKITATALVDCQE